MTETSSVNTSTGKNFDFLKNLFVSLDVDDKKYIKSHTLIDLIEESGVSIKDDRLKYLYD